MVIGAIAAVGCGSHSSDAASPADSTSESVSSPASSQAPASPTGAAPAGVPSCSTSNLRIALGNGGAAAGTDFTVLDFTNIGAASCTLYGFPGVSLADPSGVQIGAAATRNPANTPTLVTLAPGARANATLGVANAENYPVPACKPTTAAQVKVYPPNETKAIELPFTATGCTVSSAHQLSVTAVVAGAGQTH
jgi:hypothetical protein